MRYCIINADDYGWSKGVVDSIIKGYQDGFFTSTSVIVTMPSYEYGKDLLLENKNLSAGIHLSFIDGKPVRPRNKVSSLVDNNTGLFLHEDIFMKNPERIDINELRDELSAQLDKLIDDGIEPTHIDNHCHHIYTQPHWFNIAMEMARDNNLALRSPFDDIFETRVKDYAHEIHYPPDLVRNVGLAYRDQIDKMKILRTNYFWDEFSHIHRTKSSLMELFSKLPAGISEILTHPGFNDPWREIEMNIWIDDEISAYLQSSDAPRLISYGELKKLKK